MALNLSASQLFGKNILSLSPPANRLQTGMGQSLTEKWKSGSRGNSDNTVFSFQIRTKSPTLKILMYYNSSCPIPNLKKTQPFILLTAKLYHTISVITTTSSNIFCSVCNLIYICNKKIILRCFDKKDRKLKCFIEVFSCYYCHTHVST